MAPRNPSDEELRLHPDNGLPNPEQREGGRAGGGPQEFDAAHDLGLDPIDFDEPGEGEPEEFGEPDTEGDESALQEVDKSGRGARRVQAVLERERLAQEKANLLERELANLRAQQENYARQQQEASDEERIALLPWEQQVEYKLHRAQEQNRVELQKLQFQNVVNQDRSQYMAQAASDPNRRRLAQTVEQTYFQAIQSGRYIPRDDVYAYLRGKEILEREQSQGRRKVASPSAERQRVRAPNPGSNQAVSRRGGNETLAQREARLSDISF